MIFSPLEQFEIKPLLTVNNILTLSITNYVIYLIIVVALIYSVIFLLNKSYLG
jgi:hypothetical protein